MKLSIVIPAYNEAERIIETLNYIKLYLQQQKCWHDYEVIVVSDGSTDNTDEVVLNLKKDFSQLKLITYSNNRGKGFAVKTGIHASNGEVILFADADGATPIEELDKLSEPIFMNQADMVIASRRVVGANITQKQSVLRIFIGKIFSWLNILMLNMPYIDTQCGFKLFKGHLAKQLFDTKISHGFAFDVEILFYATQAKYRIVEQGVTWNDGNDSKVSPFKDGMKMLVCVVKLAWSERIITPLTKQFTKKYYHQKSL
jgi:dolichyl-phosphate beta-glucosyltransferase